MVGNGIRSNSCFCHVLSYEFLIWESTGCRRDSWWRVKSVNCNAIRFNVLPLQSSCCRKDCWLLCVVRSLSYTWLGSLTVMYSFYLIL